jgi:hypothetical protein
VKLYQALSQLAVEAGTVHNHSARYGYLRSVFNALLDSHWLPPLGELRHSDTLIDSNDRRLRFWTVVPLTTSGFAMGNLNCCFSAEASLGNEIAVTASTNLQQGTEAGLQRLSQTCLQMLTVVLSAEEIQHVHEALESKTV